MEVKISKSLLYTLLGGLVVLVLGGMVWGLKGGSVPESRPHVKMTGDDLPLVIGRSSLGGPKIPFVESENYKEYTSASLAAARSSGKATLIYFYADWCGTCAGQEPVNAAFFSRALIENLSVTGIRVNVDDHQPLMRQYGINYQHSYVLLDITGKPVDRFYGDHTEEEILQKVQQVL